MKSRTSRMEQLKAALKRFNEKKGELENTQDNLKLQNQENIKIDLEVLPRYKTLLLLLIDRFYNINNDLQ